MKKVTLIILSSILLSFVLNGCQQQASNDRKEQNVMEAKSNETQVLEQVSGIRQSYLIISLGKII